jgi:geranylgeranyl transferase type-1 subunit beta
LICINTQSEYASETYDTANIASTYAALCILKTLGDDLSRVNKPAIIAALRLLQDKVTGRCAIGTEGTPSGLLSFADQDVLCSFLAVPFGSEQDVRFVFCACAISYILDDWSGIDGPAMVRYINSCVVRCAFLRSKSRPWY